MTNSSVPPLGADLAPWARVLPSIDGPVASPVLTDEDRQRFQGIADERDRNLLASFRTAARLDPDVAGEAQRVAAKLGKPPQLVELDLELARGVVLERQLRDLRLRESHPMVMQAIENPNFLRVSYDDIENLTATDSVWQSLGRAFDAGRATNERGFIGSRMAMGLGTEQDRTRLAEIAETMRNAQRDTGFLAGSAEILGQMAGTTTAALAAGGAAAGLASLGGPVSAGAAFTWTAGAAFFTQTAAIEGGNAYLDLIDQGVADDTAGAVALGVGIFGGLLELTGAKYAAKPFQGAIRQIGRRLTGGLAQETAGRAFVTAVAEYAKGQLAEQVTEHLQEWTQIIGEAIARPEGAPEPSWSEIRGRLYGIAGKTFQGMALLGLPGPTAHYFAQNRRAEAAIQRADAFDQASQLAAASKVRQRNPDAHAAFAQRVAEEQGVQSVYVDAARFRQAMQETGTTDAELRAQLPEVFRQLEDADANPERAADVVVPAGEWQAKVTQTKVGAALQPDIRFDAEGMSRREADEWMQERSLFGAEARQAAQQAEADDLAFQQSATRVQDSLYQQIRDTGRLPDAKQARGAAQLYATFYETQARRLGMTPEALLEQFPLQFVAQDVKAERAGLFNQDVETPEFREWFGDSKVVDAEGKPLVVYHGSLSPTEDMAFDFSKIGTNGRSEGAGFYFTTEERVAAGYAKGTLLRVNLSIRKPMRLDQRGFSVPQIKKILKHAAKAEAEREGSDIRDGFLANYGDTYTSVASAVAEAAKLIAADETAVDQMGGIVGSGVDPELVNRAVADVTGFDGIVSDGFGGAGKGGGMIYVAFFPEQIKSVNNRGTFDRNDPNILRQLDGVQPGDELIALHRISADAVRAASDLGGLPVPSIGITKAATPFTGFGEIDLIGTRSMVDPATTPVFSSDAYTARFPALQWKRVAVAKADRLTEELRDAAGTLRADRGGIFDALVNHPDRDVAVRELASSDAGMILYLKETQPGAQIPTRVRRGSEIAGMPSFVAFAKSMTDSERATYYRDNAEAGQRVAVAVRNAVEEIIEQRLSSISDGGPVEAVDAAIVRRAVEATYFDADGDFRFGVVDRALDDARRPPEVEVDHYALADKVDAELWRWAAAKIGPMFAPPTIKVGRRNVPVTLANVVEAMTSDRVKSEESTMTFGEGAARAAAAVRFKTLAELQALRDRVVSPAAEEAAKAESDARLSRYRDQAIALYTREDWRGQVDTWAALDDSMRVLAKVAKLKAPTRLQVANAFRANGFKAPSPELAQETIDTAKSFAENPLSYFEAKPQRAVDFSEFVGAAMPVSTPADVQQILRASGMAVATYEGEDARASTVQDLARRLDAERGGVFFHGEGRGGFDPKRLEVLLYQQADLSTFLHEGAHFFLHVYSQLAQTGQATQEMRDDLQTFLDWRGIDSIDTWNAMSIDEQRKAHEAFAYSFELRHFDGEQAPAGLQGLFDRFKTWLRALYRNVRDKIAANYRRETGEELPILTGEVRQVMDRMLASEAEVATAEAVRNMVPLFQTQEQAGMTDEQWAEYQALDEQKRQAAVNALDEASLRQMRWMSGSRSRILKDLQAQHDAVRREVRKGVATEVLQRPEFAVPLFIRSGEMVQPDGSRVQVETEQERKMNRAQVLKALGFDKAPPKTKKVRGKSLVQFIRDAGGISAESWKKFPGEQGKEFRAAGVVRGKKGGGMAWDYMADLARSAGYGPQGISRDEESYDWFIEAIADGASGVPLYRSEDIAASGFADEEAAVYERSVAPPSPEEMEKIVRQKVLDEMGATAERRKALAPFRGLLSDDGVGIDEMAEAFGVGSGESLVRSIQRAGDVAAAIDAETDERMLAEYSELADPDERERAVERALHNEARQRMVGVELRHLDRSVAPARVMAAAAKEAARQAVAKLPVSGLLAKQFAMAEVRARRKATEAVRRGDIVEATLWKRRELLQGAMAKAVGETKAKIDEQVRQLARFARPDDKLAKTRDTRLVNAARWILSRFNLQSQTQQMGAEAAIDAVRSYDPTMYSMLEPLMIEAARYSAQAKDWRNLTVEQMQTLLAQVDGLWNQAKRVREIELDGRREDKATAIQRILAVLAPRLKGGQKARALSTGEKRKRSFGSILAGMRHVESVTLQWDGGDAGDVHRYLFAMLREPFDAYQVDRNRLVKQLFDDTAALANLGGQKIDAPELGYVFESRAELIGALLHAGNEQNLRKNGVGREWFRRPMEEGERVDTSKWWRFVQRMLNEGKLTKADLDFAQKVWDTFESDLKPRAQRAWFDNYGVYMGEVPADAFSIEIDGQRVNYRGGYFPAAADPDWVEPRQGDVSVDGVTEAGRAAMERYPSTSKGFGITRTEVYRPLLQDVRLAARAFDQELRFIHLQRPARDLASLLNNDEVTAAIREIDPNAKQQVFMPWLEDTVNNRVMAPGGNPDLNRLLVTLRRNVGLATMFGNVANALQQVTGLANASAYVPRKFLRSAAARYASGKRKRKDMVAGIVEASQFMQLRLEQQVGQVVDDITQLTAPSKFGTAAAWVQRNGYFLQRAMQNPVDVITWAAAHDQAITEGKTGKQAVRWADSVVRRSQGSGTAADISKAERAGALGRLFTQFSTFWFVQFNQIAQQQTLRGKALTAAWLIGVNGVVAGAISQVLRGGWEDEDDDGAMWDDVTGWAFGQAGSTAAATALPVGGPILWNLLTGERGGRINTGAVWSSAERSGKALRAMFLDIPFDPERELRGQDIKDVATLLSLLSGLPVSAAARPVSYGLDVALGNVEPAGAVDAGRGAITGTAAPGTR